MSEQSLINTKFLQRPLFCSHSQFCSSVVPKQLVTGSFFHSELSGTISHQFRFVCAVKIAQGHFAHP